MLTFILFCREENGVQLNIIVYIEIITLVEKLNGIPLV